MTGILLQMKLAALPGYSGEPSFPRRFQPGVIIA
jgi:hypothetical protein